MRKFTLLIMLLFLFDLSYGQLNMTLNAHVEYGQNLSDIWGYTDNNGNEYALVCLNRGVAIENITDPSNPQRVAVIASPRSSWRDAKTYENFAYFTNESFGGLQIINLKNLPNAPDSTDSYFWSPEIPGLGLLNACHNIYIDTETGYGYLSGCEINNGGIVVIDVFSDPGNPIFVAAAAPIYSHDAYVRGDFLYSSDFYSGFLSIQNIADKNNIFTVATQNTPFAGTHNAWLSDDGKTVFTTDEKRDASIAAYDISDRSDIQLLDEFRPLASVGEGLIPHNVHVKNDFLVTSYYTEGVIIIDGHRPQNLIEVGNYDTFEGGNGSFAGVWGAFPFFESGTVILSDLGSGLYVLSPEYIRACYLEGSVSDSLSGEMLSLVKVKILSDDLNDEMSDISGVYKTGQVTSGTFQVEYSKTGYLTKTIETSLTNGEVTILDIQLLKEENTEPPQVSIIKTTEEGCSPLSISLSPSAVEAGLLYEWVIEGPVSFTLVETTPEISLDQAGIYSVALNLKNTDGTSDLLAESEINVLGAPQVSFEVVTTGKTINLNNTTENGNSFIWEFGDGERSDSNSPSHTYSEAGAYTIELTAFNACSGATTSQNIMIIATGVKELLQLEQLEVYPNPFTSSTHIEYKLGEDKSNVKLLVTDIFGRKIATHPLEQKEGFIELGRGWAAGIYFIQVEADGIRSRSLKVIRGNWR